MVDPFGRHITYLRVSVTDRCDFRCIYCMAETMTFLPRQDVLTLEEIDRLASAFIAKGVRKLRLTGGEPLVRRNVMWLIERLSRHLGGGALALDAAADGLGVALTMETLAAADLATGRLMAPFELRIPLSSAYYVVCPAARANQPHIAAFREWLLAEASTTERRGTRKRQPRTRGTKAPGGSGPAGPGG